MVIHGSHLCPQAPAGYTELVDHGAHEWDFEDTEEGSQGDDSATRWTVPGREHSCEMLTLDSLQSGDSDNAVDISALVLACRWAAAPMVGEII